MTAIPSATQASVPARAGGALLYVGNGIRGTIDVFSADGGTYTFEREISDPNAPEGIHVDAAGNLYVADEGYGSESPGVGDIAVYAPGGQYPERLLVPGYNVSDVVPIDNGARMFASNFGPDGYFGPGSVSVFGKKDAPWRTMGIDGSFQVVGLVRDAHSGDVFVSYSDGRGKGHIAKFAKGKAPAHDLGVTFGTPWGIVEDGSGNLLVADGNGPVDVFSQAGASLGTIAIPGTAYRLAFDTQHKHLFATTFYNFNVEVFSYPKGKLVATVSGKGWSKSAWPDGVTFWPPPK